MHTPQGNTRSDSHEKAYRMARPPTWACVPNLSRRFRPNASGSSTLLPPRRSRYEAFEGQRVSWVAYPGVADNCLAPTARHNAPIWLRHPEVVHEQREKWPGERKPDKGDEEDGP